MLTPNKPVALGANSRAFARVSPQHIQASLSLSPCAERLYYWLLSLKKAGNPQELELAQFQEFTAQGRHRPYSLKQIWRAIWQLEGYGLLEILKRWRGDSLKLVAYHVSEFGTKMSEFGTKMSKFGTEMSEKQPSNPHGCVLSYRDIREQQTDPTPHPVVVVDEKKEEKPARENSPLVISSSQLEEVEISPQPSEIPHEENFSAAAPNQEILMEVEKLGIELHPKLKRILLSHLAALPNAIAVVKERKTKEEIRNPAGLLIKAVQNGWQPSEAPQSQSYPDGFLQWYEQAQKAGQVEKMAPNLLSVILGEIQVRVPKQNYRPWEAPYEQMPWRLAREKFPAIAVT